MTYIYDTEEQQAGQCLEVDSTVAPRGSESCRKLMKSSEERMTDNQRHELLAAVQCHKVGNTIAKSCDHAEGSCTRSLGRMYHDKGLCTW